MGLTEKRVGRYFNDNGSLSYLIGGIKVPYPVDQAITIDPFNLVNVFVNYTIKNSSHFRGTKIQFALNNLANSHNSGGYNAGHRRDCYFSVCIERRRSAEFDAGTQLYHHNHRRLRAETLVQAVCTVVCI